MKIVHWIRHGQSTANAGQIEYMAKLENRAVEVDNATLSKEMYEIMDRYPDAGLTEQGRREALATGNAMKANNAASCLLALSDD